jgi:Protein of unknown function (DUF3348)
MQQALPPTSLNGSALVGLLSQLGLAELPGGPAAKPSFVEGLGRWLGWADAIALSAALNVPAGAAAPGLGMAAAEREFSRVQVNLQRSIEAACGPKVTDIDFPSYRRRCQALQQAMETTIAALRAQLRAALAPRSPALARLAALDAVMQDLLAPREQALLALMPTLLEKHFERRRRAAPEAAPASAWLGPFRQDMRRLLQAELDLRLQPAHGLLDALRNPPPPLP